MTTSNYRDSSEKREEKTPESIRTIILNKLESIAGEKLPESVDKFLLVPNRLLYKLKKLIDMDCLYLLSRLIGHYIQDIFHLTTIKSVDYPAVCKLKNMGLISHNETLDLIMLNEQALLDFLYQLYP